MAKRKSKLHFNSKKAYTDWLAFKQIHLPRSKDNDRVVIAGRKHKVKHGE